MMCAVIMPFFSCLQSLVGMINHAASGPCWSYDLCWQGISFQIWNHHPTNAEHSGWSFSNIWSCICFAKPQSRKGESEKQTQCQVRDQLGNQETPDGCAGTLTGHFRLQRRYGQDRLKESQSSVHQASKFSSICSSRGTLVKALTFDVWGRRFLRPETGCFDVLVGGCTSSQIQKKVQPPVVLPNSLLHERNPHEGIHDETIWLYQGFPFCPHGRTGR